MTASINYHQLSRKIGLTSIAPSIDLKDRVVVITGGADGIGEAVVRGAILHGATVVAIDIQNKKLRKLKKEFGSDKFVGITRDLSKPMNRSFKEALTEVCNRFGKVDAYVMNAGVVRLGGAKDLLDPICAQEIRALHQLNAVSHLEIFQVLHPYLAKSDAGRIVATSSPIVGRPDTKTAAYALSKRDLEGISLLIKAELKEQKNTNVIVSGWVPPPVQNALSRDLKPNEPLYATPSGCDVAGLALRLISASLLSQFDGQVLVFKDKRFAAKTPEGHDYRWNVRTENGYNMGINQRPLYEGGGTDGTVLLESYDTWASRQLMNEGPAPAIDFSTPLRDAFPVPAHIAALRPK
ncbi:MAG: SDR family NAD(P)-dependent oxidoreductase [Alphaproteobacteria bacterium]